MGTNFNEDLRKRTKEFALQIIKLYAKIPKSDETRIIGKQLLRSATSVAANFRAVSRSRSDKERFAKLSVVVEEADETHFWIELLEESGLVDSNLLVDAKEEALQLTKIFSSYRKKLKSQ
jgi:four helix bundle protein